MSAIEKVLANIAMIPVVLIGVPLLFGMLACDWVGEKIDGWKKKGSAA